MNRAGYRKLVLANVIVCCCSVIIRQIRPSDIPDFRINFEQAEDNLLFQAEKDTNEFGGEAGSDLRAGQHFDYL